MDEVKGDPYRTAADPLGPVEVVYAATRGNLVGKAVLEAILPLLAAAAMGAIALGEGKPQWLRIVLSSFVALGLMGIAIWRLRVVATLRLERAAVHREGIRHESSGERSDLRWEDITRLSITFGESPIDQKRPYYRIETADRTLELDDVIPDLRDLFETIAAKVVARRLPATLEALARGEAVVIGEIALRRDRVDLGGTSVEWKDVDEVLVEDGRFHVVTSTGAAPSRAVPDFVSSFLLLELCDRLMSLPAGAVV